MAKLEELAKELETILQNSDEELTKKKLDRVQVEKVIINVKNDEYDRVILVQEMENANLRYFSNKLKTGYYDNEEVI